MMPTAAELTYFFEISKTLNFTRAAKNLCISQPALTRAVQHLEKTLGVELFIRHKNGVAMTHAGKKILLRIRPLMECWKNTTLEAVSSHTQVQGHIKIGCHSTIGLFIHGIMKNLLDTYPKLYIDIYTANSTQISQRVIDLEIDIGIVAIPTQNPDLIMRKISEAHTSLWVSKEMSYTKETIITNPDYHQTTAILKKCKATNINYQRNLQVNSFEVIASLTAHGCGMGILPAYFVKHFYVNKMVPIDKSPVVIDSLYLIYRKEYTNIQVIKAAPFT